MGKPEGKKILDPQSSRRGGTTFRFRGSTIELDEDASFFLSMAQELKDEGNKLFQKRDHEGAMIKYEKALKLLPPNHIDVAHLHSSMAECHMQLGLGEYPQAINECNLALEVSSRYSKALLKRARCYEALNRLDLAYKDVNTVLGMEPNNIMALEIVRRLRKVMAEKEIQVELEVDFGSPEARKALHFGKTLRDKTKRKQVVQYQENTQEDKIVVEDKVNVLKDKVVVTNSVEEEKVATQAAKDETAVTRTVKLVYGDDIRFAQLPLNCSIVLLRGIVQNRFPGLKGVLIKYRDVEGDLVTITSTDELRMAEKAGGLLGSLRFYLVAVSPDQEPLYDGMHISRMQFHNVEMKSAAITDSHNIENKPTDLITETGHIGKSKEAEKEKGYCVVDSWLVHFAMLFKNHVGFDSDSFLDLHEIGMKLYSEAMEDTVTWEEAGELFEIAADQFQEMAALAFFNWGNIHMSLSRKSVSFSEDGSPEQILEQARIAYEWAHKEYDKAGRRYGEAMKIKPDFYEGLLAHALQCFEQAKLCWCNAIGNNIDLDAANLDSGPYSEVLQLYNKAEESMDMGMQMWEEMEEQRLHGISKLAKYKPQLQRMGLDGLFQNVSADEAAERNTNMKSQINLLWGKLLYERSVVEYKLGLPTWDGCLEVAVEKFELSGASPMDLTVMLKNHCSNDTALNGLGFNIDEIVQAWNDMDDVNRWQFGVPAFRLEPLLRRRPPKLHSMLEEL